MLNREKLLLQLAYASSDYFGSTQLEKEMVMHAWNRVSHDPNIADFLQSKKWSLLIPKWQGILSQVIDISSQSHPYQVFAVDGSQIYYDKHQGPPCFLINIGTVFFSYQIQNSSVQFYSEPIVVFSSSTVENMNVDSVNLKREQAELAIAVNQLKQIKKEQSATALIALFDGTLIFSHTDGFDDQKNEIFSKYIEYLMMLYREQILHAGYISFPKSKELINVLKICNASFDEKLLHQVNFLDKYNDMDVIELFLKPNQRTMVFESKVVISYVYPKNLKPYFCYLHVGFEIVRLEFPAWIAQNQNFVNQVCSIVLDQAKKGQGYPVCLFEAHEQAVVKNYDRDFFYHMIQKITQQHAKCYQASLKSMKKLSVPV